MGALPISDSQALLSEYEAFLSGKTHSTIDAYIRAIRQVILSIVERPGSGGEFYPPLLTKTAIETYIAYLDAIRLQHCSSGAG